MTIVIAGLAFLLSLLSFLNSKKNNLLSLNAVFFQHIHKEYLLMDIPKARARILYNDANGKLLGIDNLIEVLNNIRRDSLFYKFTDKKLYNKITEINQQIEDRLVKITHLSPEESDKVLEFLNDSIEELYKVIMKSYRGK